MASTNCSVGKLNESVHMREVVIVVGTCSTFYEGRGAAHSEFGDKIIIIKEDGSVIIHGPTGFRPLNWQPDTVHIEFSEEEDGIVLKAIRAKPRETLVVKCRKIHSCINFKPKVNGGFYMYFSEKEIRDILLENPEMIEEGLRIVEAEKPVEPGFIDLYGVDKKGNIVVFEIKRVKASEEAAKQLYWYVERLKKSIPHIRGVLLAPSFTESARSFLERAGLEYRVIDLKKIYGIYSDKVEAIRNKRRVKSLTDYMK